MRLKLKYDVLLSNFADNFNLRRYTVDYLRWYKVDACWGWAVLVHPGYCLLTPDIVG
jgi:hypothetical protein